MGSYICRKAIPLHTDGSMYRKKASKVEGIMLQLQFFNTKNGCCHKTHGNTEKCFSFLGIFAHKWQVLLSRSTNRYSVLTFNSTFAE